MKSRRETVEIGKRGPKKFEVRAEENVDE